MKSRRPSYINGPLSVSCIRQTHGSSGLSHSPSKFPLPWERKKGLGQGAQYVTTYLDRFRCLTTSDYGRAVGLD